MTIETRAYSPRGPVALEPSAFGLSFSLFGPPPEPFSLVAEGKAAVVDICGPLTLADPFFDRYSAIQARVDAALASAATSVILKFNSPGGDVFGVFDCARHMRTAAARAGKPLVAFTESSMHSSAYALACSAGRIVVSDTASCGSIGVIATAVEQTRADAAQGVSFALITSGARKADGNPHVPLGDDARAAMQLSVDAMAEVFFEHVATARPALANPAGLQAGVAVGAQALSLGLADAVMSWDALVESIASGAILASSTMAEPEKDEKPKEDAIRASLVTASESDDPKKAARAKAALAAYDSDEEEKPSEKPKGASAEFPPKEDEKPKSEKPESDESKAMKATISSLGTELKTLREREAARSRSEAAAERSAFLASRPDLSKEILASVVALPFEQLKGIVNAIPAPAGFVNPFVARTEGAPAVGDTFAVAAGEDAELDRRMGLTASHPLTVENVGSNIQRFGVRKASVK